jgi:hypothetical protein
VTGREGCRARGRGAIGRLTGSHAVRRLDRPALDAVLRPVQGSAARARPARAVGHGSRGRRRGWVRQQEVRRHADPVTTKGVHSQDRLSKGRPFGGPSVRRAVRRRAVPSEGRPLSVPWSELGRGARQGGAGLAGRAALDRTLILPARGVCRNGRNCASIASMTWRRIRLAAGSTPGKSAPDRSALQEGRSRSRGCARQRGNPTVRRHSQPDGSDQEITRSKCPGRDAVQRFAQVRVTGPSEWPSRVRASSARVECASGVPESSA